MKRTTLLLPVLILTAALFSGCGGSTPSPEAPETAFYPDPVAFLHGTAPSTYEEDSGFVDQTFALEEGYGPLGKQYVDALLEGPYELSLISSHETEKESALYENYYLTYNGTAEVGQINMTETCSIYVGVNHYDTTAETYIRVLTAKGFTPVDNGERADVSVLSVPPADGQAT